MIPKILQGTKAMPFIKICQIQASGVSVISTEDIKEILPFLSGDFTPGDIPKLFEGWENSKQTNPDAYFLGLNGYLVTCVRAKTGWHITIAGGCVGKSANQYIDFRRIQTLNDFISDCTRAGITLTYIK